MQHGRDMLFQFYPEMFRSESGAENPAEEMFRIKKGADCGWPYCYFDNDKNAKLLNPEYGGDRNKVGRCEMKTKSIVQFPGHLAPNGLLFYTGSKFPAKYKNGAFIAFHGSWNRAPEPQAGYFVVFVPFKDGMPTAKWEVFADGFAGANINRATIVHAVWRRERMVLCMYQMITMELFGKFLIQVNNFLSQAEYAISL